MTLPISLQDQLRKELDIQRDALQSSAGALDASTIVTKNKLFELPDGERNDGPLRCIILDWRYVYSYFPNAFDEANIKPPICSAKGKAEAELSPSERSDEPQNEDCPTCTQNQFGSKFPNDKNNHAKACKNEILIALIKDEKPNSSTTPLLIKLTPGAITNFRNFVKGLQNTKSLLPCQVAVDLDFDPKVSKWAKLTYSNPKQHTWMEDVLKIRTEAQTALDI